MKRLIHLIHRAFFGDCSRRGCGHSVVYHMPLVGCAKCDCEEYK